MYDPHAALAAIDAHSFSILACLLATVIAVFVYFFIAVRMAIRQQVYVVPFVGAAVFLWHDFTFVTLYEQWFTLYDHWWVKMWWLALLASVGFELFLVYQVIRYGHKELFPGISRRAFTALVVLGTLGVGGGWWLVKASIGDPLFFITFAITAVWSVPFHTALMCRRQSRAGQSIVMEASTIVMILSLSAAFAQIDPFFRSPPYLAFVAAFSFWALANIWLILRLPEVRSESTRRTGPAAHNILMTTP